MGLFQDSFEVGAGATLGSLATVTAYNLTDGILDAATQKAYNSYRSQYFDTVVRADLCDIMVKKGLPQRAYPFPNSSQTLEKRANFFVRHKVFTVVLILLVLNIINVFKTAMTGNMPDDASMLSYGGTFMLLFFVGIGMVIMKIGKIGKKAYAKATYKTQLENDGQQYWYVREYIRQAMAAQQLTVNEAAVKMSNTRLAQQLPDTAEEIDAHIFYYQQRLGLV